jgi:hypothetical protein
MNLVDSPGVRVLEQKACEGRSDTATLPCICHGYCKLAAGAQGIVAPSSSTTNTVGLRALMTCLHCLMKTVSLRCVGR